MRPHRSESVFEIWVSKQRCVSGSQREMSGGGKQLKSRDKMVLLPSRFVNVTGSATGVQYGGQRGLPGGASVETGVFEFGVRCVAHI